MNNTEIYEKGIVKSIQKNSVVVERISEGSCSACMIRNLCNIENQIEITIETQQQFQIGEKIYIVINPNARILSAFMVFIVPILIFLLFYIILNSLFGLSEVLSIGLSFLSLFFSFIFIKVANKKFEKKFAVKIERIETNENTDE